VESLVFLGLAKKEAYAEADLVFFCFFLRPPLDFVDPIVGGLADVMALIVLCKESSDGCFPELFFTE